MNLSLVSRTLLEMSQCKVTWRKLYVKNFEDLWDKNPDKMVKLLTMGRFEHVDEIKLESKQRRGILTWAKLITALENRNKEFRLTLDSNIDGLLPNWFAQLALTSKCLTLKENLNMSRHHKLELAKGISLGKGKTTHIKIACCLKDIKAKEDCKILYMAHKMLHKVETDEKYLNKPQSRCLKLLTENYKGNTMKKVGEESCRC